MPNLGTQCMVNRSEDAAQGRRTATPQKHDRVVAGRQACSLSHATRNAVQAATLGALDAGCPVGGIRIAREAGNAVLSASYLPADCQVMCRFLSSRKVALTDAGVRNQESDRTAFVFLPGGLGTMDELFELLCLVQLRKLGSRLGVPLILCNYDGFYTGLMDFLVGCDYDGVLKACSLSPSPSAILRQYCRTCDPLPASLCAQ